MFKDDKKNLSCFMRECIFWSSLYKIKAMITSVKEILELSNFGHKAKHCVKSARIWSYSDPHYLHQDWIRRDTLYLSLFSPNEKKCRPEYLRRDTFYKRPYWQSNLIRRVKLYWWRRRWCLILWRHNFYFPIQLFQEG